MNYIGSCPKCKHRTIVTINRKINHNPNTKLPQKVTKCLNCGVTSRITITGEVIKPSKQQNKEIKKQLAIDPNYKPDEYAISDRLIFRLWKRT